MDNQYVTNTDMAKPGPKPGQPHSGQFKPGNTQGIKPGQSGMDEYVRGKRLINTAFVKAIAEDFQTNGESVISTLRTEHPVEYGKMLIALLPKEASLDINNRHFIHREMSDDELLGIISSARTAGPETISEIDSSIH